ncbi:hypothetical protein RHGRI_038879 [Rhododendron griersonianum]|uniref:Enoyl reductase (ER) domain-containing protein n=1 Tax=Rhododendron griersonianum TaxID=479676 RepID=A0AAV6HIC1_9ERIC|nr:hypothetical protein RHGRI_038879 [Rhododendron griersonianum]
MKLVCGKEEAKNSRIDTNSQVTDVAGEVVEVGFGVKKFKSGDKVVAYLSPFSGGGLAEFAVAKENLTVPRPPEVSAAEGAGLPVAGLTAHQALTQSAGVKLDGSGPRKNLLITAASGGVGLYAVQLAKLGNTHVTATCGARNLDFVKGLGADEVLDYKTPDGAALKSPSSQKYDAVIHCAMGIPFSAFEPNLSPNGKVIDLTPSFGSFMTSAVKKLTCSKKQLVPLFAVPKGENLDYLVQLVKEGKLKTVIDSKHPLSKAEEAWAKSIDGHATGKIIHVEVPVRAPKKNEVLIKVEAASLNPFDWKMQKGVMRPILPSKFPYIPVADIAGEVVEVGFRVKKFKPGDKVVAFLSPFSGGGLAEFAVAKENLTVPRPPEVSAAEAAGLPIAGLTAHQALPQSAGVKLDGSGPRKNLLITAASGGVGHYAVQLAKLGNTHVTATCGAHNLDFVKGLGADEVLDYRTPDGAALKSPSGQKYDVVIHCATGTPFSAFEPNLSPNGKVIDMTLSFGSFMTFAVKKLTCSKKQLVTLLVVPKHENLDYLVQLVKDGKLKTVIDSKHPLSEAEEAWAKSIDGHATGKIIDGCNPNGVMYSLLVHGLCEAWEIEEAFRLKEEMSEKSCRPSTRTYTVLIKALCDIGLTDKAFRLA